MFARRRPYPIRRRHHGRRNSGSIMPGGPFSGPGEKHRIHGLPLDPVLDHYEPPGDDK